MKNIIFKNNLGLKIIFFISFFCFGLFHEFTACLFLGVEFIYLVYLFLKKDIYVYDNLSFILMIFIIFMYLFVIFFAVDKGMSLIGFLKQLSILLFIIILMQYNKQEREELLFIIPYIGILMVFISIIGYIIPVFHDLFIVNNRIGSFFQYPNTFALFLLIGCIILYFHKKQYYLMKTFVLLTGIILTGSRTIYIFTIVIFIYFCIKDQQYIKPIAIFVLCLLVFVMINYLFNINIKVLERLSQFSFSSSTFLGRLLYYKDGLKICFSHPLGLGYLGYYFLEPSIQTGVYSIRFIHNDILQIALDVGILPCLLFITVLVSSFISKKINKESKVIIIVIILHSLFDFNLQFVSVFFVLVICLDLYSGNQTKLFSKKYKILSYSMMSICIVISIYTGLALSFHYFGLTDLSIQYLPIYTEAKIEKLKVIDDMEQGIKLAKSIEKYNVNVAIVYDVYAVYEMQRNNYRQMISYKEKSLELQKYNIDTYDNYINMLYIATEYYKENETIHNEYIDKIKSVPFIIDRIKKDTDNLAYKINDKPDLELSTKSKQIIDYIKNLEE